jgi:hypothetical protein
VKLLIWLVKIEFSLKTKPIQTALWPNTTIFDADALNTDLYSDEQTFGCEQMIRKMPQDLSHQADTTPHCHRCYGKGTATGSSFRRSTLTTSGAEAIAHIQLLTGQGGHGEESSC